MTSWLWTPSALGPALPQRRLRHTLGHLMLLHLKQEDKGDGVALDRPWGPRTQGAFQRQVEEWDEARAARRLCGRRKGQGLGGEGL